MIRITVAEQAGQDIEDLYAYIAKDDIVAADRHRDRLARRWEQLAHQPRIGRARDDLKPGYRSITEGEYPIIYRIVSSEEVIVMRVIHTKRDLGNALKD